MSQGGTCRGHGKIKGCRALEVGRSSSALQSREGRCLLAILDIGEAATAQVYISPCTGLTLLPYWKTMCEDSMTSQFHRYFSPQNFIRSKPKYIREATINGTKLDSSISQLFTGASTFPRIQSANSFLLAFLPPVSHKCLSE